MEFVVEPVVSELFKGLFKILESKEVQDFARNLVGVDSELKELGEKVQMVENLLGNAEDKQLTDKRVKEWLDNLQDWAFDAEDLLDEFAYHASRRKLKAEHQASSSKVMSCLRASFPSPFHMGSKIKDITCRLEQLQQKRSAEHEMQVVSGGTSSNVAAPQRPEETSSVPPEQLPDTLQKLYIGCYELKTLSRCQYLPKALTYLFIKSCRELKSIDGSFEGKHVS
ncbi:hypothetical protein Pint_26459 [Pistacia integerrima]|uniref:Uncharacterized protein n=1 Tax=Pistacia integerrima TaxID=434235 RepID=A0ACC0YD75_9ROSI|nr:hypothetical protein Pint_26459 [Pistacia integerrima]